MNNNYSKITMVDKNCIVNDAIDRIETVEDKVDQYSQDTNKYLENIDHKIDREFASIGTHMLSSVKTISDINISTLNTYMEYNNTVFKTHHDSLLTFMSPCFTSLFKLMNDSMIDVDQNQKKIMKLLKILSISVINLTIVMIIVLIVLICGVN